MANSASALAVDACARTTSTPALRQASASMFSMPPLARPMARSVGALRNNRASMHTSGGATRAAGILQGIDETVEIADEFWRETRIVPLAQPLHDIGFQRFEYQDGHALFVANSGVMTGTTRVTQSSRPCPKQCTHGLLDPIADHQSHLPRSPVWARVSCRPPRPNPRKCCPSSTSH